MQSYVTPHIEGKRYTNIGGSWAATIFSVKFHFFFLQCNASDHGMHNDSVERCQHHKEVKEKLEDT